MKCISCEYGGKHCMGTYSGCICECAAHTLPPDDDMQDVIALLTASAHEDQAMFEELLVEMSEGKMIYVIVVLISYISWMLKQANIDPVEMIQATALYWAGGEPKG